MIPTSPSCFLVLFQTSLPGESPGNLNPPMISSLGPQRREEENRLSVWMWRASSELQGMREGGKGFSFTRGRDLSGEVLSWLSSQPFIYLFILFYFNYFLNWRFSHVIIGMTIIEEKKNQRCLSLNTRKVHMWRRLGCSTDPGVCVPCETWKVNVDVM